MSGGRQRDRKRPQQGEFFLHLVLCCKFQTSKGWKLWEGKEVKFIWIVVGCFAIFLLIWCINTLFASISVQQLHSSVRTGNLETCLRLLSLGAQANFFHPVSWAKKKKVIQKSNVVFPTNVFFLCWGWWQEKGNTPLHIAARAGQILQAELLAVYGADPGALDSSGKTPTDYAR